MDNRFFHNQLASPRSVGQARHGVDNPGRMDQKLKLGELQDYFYARRSYIFNLHIKHRHVCCQDTKSPDNRASA
jgi:hypothetical protein